MSAFAVVDKERNVISYNTKAMKLLGVDEKIIAHFAEFTTPQLNGSYAK